ncbi:MAG: leucyl aminopeptidase [Deltaproteobacteria bacterium]
MEFKLSAGDISKTKCALAVVSGFEGEGLSGAAKQIDEAMEGALAGVAQDEKFTGEFGKFVEIYTLGKAAPERVLYIGIGKRGSLSADALRKIGITAAKRAKGLSGSIAFGIETEGKKGLASALIEGMILGSYDFDKYKTGAKKDAGLREIEIFEGALSDRAFQEELKYAKAISDATNFARDLVNEPPVVVTPTKLAQTAIEVAADGNLKCEIFDAKQMLELGMGGLIAVSLGSLEPPKFIHLTYEPARKAKKTVAVIGKGITFDTGGLCIKPRESMKTMKMDMAGAACVLGVMKAISKLNPSVRVHGLISATENMPGGRAYKPDDVIYALNGKTIEVIDTDAEGRIVLADALSYAVRLGAEEMVDLATLTGACMVALGSYTAGIMGNSEKLIDKVLKAAKGAGEKVWQLPMDDELRKEIESDVADVKNVGSRFGGAITAAMFLEKFVSDTPWAHLDIAGPAFIEKGGEWYPKGGTGFGVRTIVKYLLDS